MFRNHTLSAMSADDRTALFPHLIEREVLRGDILTQQGDAVTEVYFPATANLSNTVRFQDGRATESFIMGLEGVSGLSAFLADEPCAWTVEVKSSGVAYSLPAAALRKQFDLSPALRKQLLRLAYDYQAQAALTAGCSHFHTTTARLARTLAIMADRLEQSRLVMTQEELAEVLGVQRTTLNAAALELRADKTIRYSRGVITIVDHDRLRRAACECLSLYEAVVRPRVDA